MANNQNQTVLVTGASSGIGYELAKIFAENGYNLVVVARSTEELHRLAADFTATFNVKVTPLTKDLFVPGAAQQIYDEIKAKGIIINILVNNAGQGVYGEFKETDLKAEVATIQLNVIALVELTKLFLQDMIGRGEGKILQLASMVSKIPSPLQAVYAGTKAFIYNFSQSLANELKDSNITVTALRPGATDTDFFHKAGAENTKIYQEGELADPYEVAKDGYQALMNGDTTVVSGAKNNFQDKLGNILPDEMLAEQMHKQNEPVNVK